jgi:tripartite-type tricarboxylate transporter receptor subunit TctC
MPSRRTILQLLPLLAANPLSALAQNYPARPVRVVVPISPGSGTDGVARYMSAELSKVLGGSFVVENRVGASGNIGTTSLPKHRRMDTRFCVHSLRTIRILGLRRRHTTQ